MPQSVLAGGTQLYLRCHTLQQMQEQVVTDEASQNNASDWP
jgi:hypothetical protein